VSFVKNIPQRTCIGCNCQKDKNNLIRVVKDNNSQISIDRTGKAAGRGAYICDNIECLDKAIKSKKLEKNFNMGISNEIYENLGGVISGK